MKTQRRTLLRIVAAALALLATITWTGHDHVVDRGYGRDRPGHIDNRLRGAVDRRV